MRTKQAEALINQQNPVNGKWKFFCAILALLYGDYVFGMDYNKEELYENPWKDKQSKSTSNQKTLTRFERQQRELQRLREEFKNDQEKSEKLRKEVKKTDKNPNNGSRNVKKMVEQIEQRSKIEEKPSYSKLKQNKRPSFGIEVNHKSANLFLKKKDKPLFDKKNIRLTENNSANTNADSDAMDWEPTPSISDLE